MLLALMRAVYVGSETVWTSVQGARCLRHAPGSVRPSAACRRLPFEARVRAVACGPAQGADAVAWPVLGNSKHRTTCMCVQLLTRPQGSYTRGSACSM